MSIGQSKLKLLSGNWISIFSNSDLDLDHRHLGINPKLRLDVSYPYSKFGSIGQSKLKLLSGNWISIFSNNDLDLNHRHLGSNPKLPLDISYPYSKFGVIRLKQTKVIERKPNVDAQAKPRMSKSEGFSFKIIEFSKIWPGDLILTRHDPYLNIAKILPRQTFWPSFIKIGSQQGFPMIWPGDLVFDPSFIKIWSQIWPLESKQKFSKICHRDLVFDPAWPIFELGLDIVKTNILIKFHQNWVANVASGV